MPRVSRGPHLYLKRRPGGRALWYVRDGKSRFSTGCEQGDHRGARDALAAYLARAIGAPKFGDGDPDRVTVSDVLALYAADKADANSRPKEARARLLRLDAGLGHLAVNAITPTACLDYARGRGAAQAARRELEDLRAAIRYAYLSRKLAREIPVTLPPKAVPRDRWLTRSEAARLLAGAMGWLLVPCCDLSTRRERWSVWGRPGERNRHVARFIVLGLGTGTRHDAILGLGWRPHHGGGHVDMERGLIYRRAAGEDETAKRRPPTPILGSLGAHLARWRRHDGPLRLYVVAWEGRRIDRMQRAWRSACRLAGLSADVTPHVMRHTYATWQMQAGVDRWVAAGRAGMTVETLERVYGHHSPEFLRDQRRA